MLFCVFRLFLNSRWVSLVRCLLLFCVSVWCNWLVRLVCLWCMLVGVLVSVVVVWGMIWVSFRKVFLLSIVWLRVL